MIVYLVKGEGDCQEGDCEVLAVFGSVQSAKRFCEKNKDRARSIEAWPCPATTEPRPMVTYTMKLTPFWTERGRTCTAAPPVESLNSSEGA